VTLFVVHCLDKPDATPRRLAAIDAHRAYLEKQGHVDIVISGPLQSDDGETMIGSFFMVEAPDRAAVERFQADDPLFGAGVWAQRNIQRFFRRVG